MLPLKAVLTEDTPVFTSNSQLLNYHFSDYSTLLTLSTSLPQASCLTHPLCLFLLFLCFTHSLSLFLAPPHPPTLPPNLPSHTLCLTHLLSARQVSVARRQAMSAGLLLWEWRLSIMISSFPLLLFPYWTFLYEDVVDICGEKLVWLFWLWIFKVLFFKWFIIRMCSCNSLGQ